MGRRPAGNASEAPLRRTGRKKRVFVAENEGVIALDIESILTSTGRFDVDMAYSTDDAVQRAAEFRPDILLMEISLKGSFNAIEAAERIVGRNPIPVFYLVPCANDGMLPEAERPWCCGYVEKVFDREDVLEAVESVTEDSG
jgi:AmiR/NasT family two-component response regulator